MTTSCCPSWIELANKHIPRMKPFISSTGSPMYYAARIAKEKHPDAQVVFIGPCVAKRKEARRDECVDFVITFEEINSIFDGLGIEVDNHRSVPHSVRFDPGRPRLRTGRRRDGRRTAFLGGQQPAEGRRHPGLQPEQEKRIPAPRLCQIGQSPGDSSSRSWPAKADVSRVPAPTTCTMPVNGNSRRNWLNAKSDGAMKELVDHVETQPHPFPGRVAPSVYRCVPRRERIPAQGGPRGRPCAFRKRSFRSGADRNQQLLPQRLPLLRHSTQQSSGRTLPSDPGIRTGLLRRGLPAGIRRSEISERRRPGSERRTADPDRSRRCVAVARLRHHPLAGGTDRSLLPGVVRSGREPLPAAD